MSDESSLVGVIIVAALVGLAIYWGLHQVADDMDDHNKVYCSMDVAKEPFPGEFYSINKHPDGTCYRACFINDPASTNENPRPPLVVSEHGVAKNCAYHD